MPFHRQDGLPDPLLTNVAVQWGEANADMYPARRVFPTVRTSKSHGTYRKGFRSYATRNEVAFRPRGGYPRQVDFQQGSGTFTIEERSLEGFLDDRDRADELMDMETEKGIIRTLQSQHLIDGEQRWASAYFKTGVWATDRAGVAASPTGSQFLQWDNANSDPILLLDEAGLTVGGTVGDLYRPNMLVLGSLAALRLRNHPIIQGRLGDNKDRILGTDDLARFFGMRPGSVVVPGGIVNTGPEKETAAATETAAVYSRIVGAKDALLVYANPAPSTQAPSGGYTFSWTGYLGADADNPLASVIRGREARAHSDWFHVLTAYEHRIVAPELGVFFSNAVAG